MQDNYTHICMVLDASGSMSDVESETRESFNTYIKEQQEIKGKATLEVYQFDDVSKKVVEFADLAQFKNNVMENYHCDGCTALNDAVCQAIDETGQKLAAMKEEERPAKVSFVILTDGMENASRKFTAEDVRNRIQHQTDVYKWDFVYLGANQDAFATGGHLGFSVDRCLNICASEAGDMEHNMRVLKHYSKARRTMPVEMCCCMSMESFEKMARDEEKDLDADATATDATATATTTTKAPKSKSKKK